MKLIEALEILKQPAAEDSPEFNVFLACGFESLHLRTFLAADLRRRGGQRVDVRTGLFGDLCGNLERLDPAGIHACVVVLEWQDLDPRFGVRNLGGWRPEALADAADGAGRTSVRIEQAASRLAECMPVILSMPALPLPPLFPAPASQVSAVELNLRHTVASLAESLSRMHSVRIVSAQALDEASAPTGRYDLKSDINTGFPYSLAHASACAELIASLIENRPPKKGLITDLDDTLWAGIVGEGGIDGVSWSPDRHSHLHGVYQQFLASLAGAGILIGVASKNDPTVVAQAFERKDLLISKREIFPFEVHWNKKSQSVGRILAAWNVGADSVVFVDDSPIEVAEVKESFPQLECLVFPKQDYAAFWTLLRRLRDTFGKTSVTTEDTLRLSSIRDAAAWREASNSKCGVSDEFLKAAEGCLVIELDPVDDSRALELINKTNQFNLNGRRFTEQEWKRHLTSPGAFLMIGSYGDKFGSLGKIAVMLGRRVDRRAHIESWVMSCRALSRRIEHHCLRYLFEALDVDEAILKYEATPRNGPLQLCLSDLEHSESDDGMIITRQQFIASAPALLHRVQGGVHARS
jgi:FkbH-like protein